MRRRAISARRLFLYIDPLKQGLKRLIPQINSLFHFVFIHRSIKTRIETFCSEGFGTTHILFLYIDPLKQGLKRFYQSEMQKSYQSFYT